MAVNVVLELRRLGAKILAKLVAHAMTSTYVGRIWVPSSATRPCLPADSTCGATDVTRSIHPGPRRPSPPAVQFGNAATSGSTPFFMALK